MALIAAVVTGSKSQGIQSLFPAFWVQLLAVMVDPRGRRSWVGLPPCRKT